ncbi:hypothetical protein PMAYCL1PPCAC_03203, partial [Pristionchus mayeri]
ADMRTFALSAIGLLLIMLKASQATPAAQPGFSPARGNFRAADDERANAASRYSAQPSPPQSSAPLPAPVRPGTNSTRLGKAKKAKRCCCCCCPCCCGCGCCGCGCGCCGCGCGCCGCGCGCCGCGCCKRRRRDADKKGVNKGMRPDYSSIRRSKRAAVPEKAEGEEECDCKEEQAEKPETEERCECDEAKDEKEEKCEDEPKEEKCG